MLVIISDLHLTDGTSGSTISTGAFHLLAERLGDLAVRASERADGGYRPIERIDLLLLGDVLDVIRSSRWLTSRVRPWDNPDSPEMIEMVSTITRDILRHNADALAVLRGLSIDGTIRVPPASRTRRPALGAAGQPVPVRTHYMVGNHDWFYHLPGEAYDTIRRQVAQHLGLATAHDQPFPHDPRESDDLQEVLRRHRTFARHGDIFDPFNFEQDRDASSLGDAIVVELLNRFSQRVEESLRDELPADTVLGLREIDNIRPLLLIPVWIDGLLERTCSFPAMRKQVKQVWDGLAEEFLDLAYVRARDSWNPADLVDGLQRALQFSKKLPIGWASAIAQWIHKVGGAGSSAYYKNALAEQEFRNRRAQHVVYGHTHHTESVPLDASFAEGRVLNQVYFNSGTWRRVHRQTTLAPSEHEFIASDTMTYLVFFEGDERGGRPYETWTGTLALSPADLTARRPESTEAAHAAGQSISTPELRVHGPHFTPQPTVTSVIPTRRV